MADSFIQQGVDGAGKKSRTYEKSTAGHDNFVVYSAPWKIEGTYTASSFRIAGGTAGQEILCGITNAAAATRSIAIRRLSVDIQKSTSAVFSTPTYISYYHLTNVQSGGTLATVYKFDSGFPISSTQTEIRFPASADGTATTITGLTPTGNPARRQAHPMNLSTAAAQWLTDDLDFGTFGQEPMILRPGEAGQLQLSAITNNTLHYTVKVIWDEITFP